MRSTNDLNRTTPWRKASRSNNGADNCVEIASLTGNRAAVRDSKDPDGAALVFDTTTFATFLNHIKSRAPQD